MLLHALTAALLFLVLARMTNAPGRSFVVAGLFAFHPVQVESVAWVTERKDVLSTFFLVLTLWAYTLHSARPGVGRYLLIVLFFSLGLMAKPMLVTLPVVLLFLDFWPLERWRNTTWRRLVLEKVPLLLLALAAGLLTIWTQKHGTAVRSLNEFSLYARLGNAIVGYVVYLGMLVWPYPLAVFYPHPGELPVWKVVASALFLLLVTGVVWRRRKESPQLLTGWLWYVITLGPVSGVLQAGWQGQADRFLYVPSIGLFILAVWQLHRRFQEATRPLAVLAGVVLLGCVVGTRLQLRHWQNSLTLWEHTVAVTPANFTAFDSLAAALLDRGRAEEAIEYLKRAHDLMPTHELASYLLGGAYRQLKRLDEATVALNRALAISPEYIDAHVALAEVLAERGRPDEGEPHALRALELDPRLPVAHQALGVVRLRQGRTEEGLDCLRAALRLDPHSLPTRVLLRNELRSRGRLEEAAEQERLLKRYYPGWEPR